MSTGEEILGRIMRRIAALGLSESSVGVQAGLSRDVIRSIRRGIESGRQRGVSTDTIQRIAPVLGTSAEWLVSGTGPEEAEPDQPEVPTIPLPPGSEIVPAPVDLPSRNGYRTDLPVMGTAAGSVIRHVDGFRLEHEVIDLVRRPPALASNDKAYAIFVVGDSMAPKHLPGDLCFVNPLERPQIDDSVIVQTRNHDDDPGQAYIKVLRKRTASHLVLQQYNPLATIEIPLQFVIAIHRVMTVKDLFGV